MLNIPVTAADAVRRSSEFDPWGAIRIEGGPVIADLKSCRQKVVSRRKAVKDTGERWFGAGTVASSPVSEAAPRPTVRISDVVEVGVVQYVDERNKVSIVVVDLCQIPGRARGDECRWVLLLQKKNNFLLEVRLAVPLLKLLLKRVFESQIREEVVVIAIMPQFSKRDNNNNLVVFMYRLLAIEI